MPVIVRPSRKVSLSDHVRANPRQPWPSDLLDLQIHNLIEAIKSTQGALEDIRRDDGKLKNRSVGVEQLNTDIARLIVEGVEARAACHAGTRARRRRQRPGRGRSRLADRARRRGRGDLGREIPLRDFTAPTSTSRRTPAMSSISPPRSRATPVRPRTGPTTPRRRPTTRSPPKTKRCNGRNTSPAR